MNKKLKIVFIVTGIIIFLGILSFIGIFSVMNNSLNSLFAGIPNKSCSVDSDCDLEKTKCNPCDCGSAVNKDWNRFCPLPDLSVISIYCKGCMALGYDIEVKCLNNQCQTVSINR